METIWSKMLNVLEERGWCKGHYTDTFGNVCLEKAFGIVTRPEVVSDRSVAKKAYDRLLDAVGYTKLSNDCFDCADTHIHSVPYWNDLPERTFLDVKSLLVRLHEEALDIGEEKKEVEFVPLEAPAEVPVEPTPAPVETPAEEPVPA